MSTLVLVPTDVATTLEDEPAALLWLWWRIVYWWVARRRTISVTSLSDLI